MQCSVWDSDQRKFYKFVTNKFVAMLLTGNELKRVKMKVLWVLPAAGEEKKSGFLRISGEKLINIPPLLMTDLKQGGGDIY